MAFVAFCVVGALLSEEALLALLKMEHLSLLVMARERPARVSNNMWSSWYEMRASRSSSRVTTCGNPGTQKERDGPCAVLISPKGAKPAWSWLLLSPSCARVPRHPFCQDSLRDQ